MPREPAESGSLRNLPWWQAVPLTVAAAALLVAGWRLFWFLTDDAFIAFRYASNAMAGRGLVWNPEPFLPVEGYSSFLWVVLLLAIWKATGVPPPESANVLSLLFGAGTLVLAASLVMRTRLPASWRAYRFPLLAAALAGILLNRTFLAWLSSGLETALFEFLLLAWIALVLGGATAGPPAVSARRELPWALALSATAALAALARPDGLLAVAATPLVLLLPDGRDPAASSGWRKLRWRRALWGSLPLAAVAAHLLWRRSFYGAWLPNTHAAKVVEPWPEAGLYYGASFAVENGLWLWAVLAAAAALRSISGRGGLASAGAGRRARVALVAAVLLAHAGYYLGVVGGDHFEYRVLSHLVPLAFVSAVALLPRVTASPRLGLGLLLALVAVSLPIQWLHWDETRQRTTREETFQMAAPVAHRFPPPLRQAVARWDRWQAWLQARSVGARQQEHKVLYEALRERLPSREEGAGIPWGERPVNATTGVGMIGWILPDVAVIDLHGLNDRVIARNPVSAERRARRVMAHDRRPPPGYVECFRPNVSARGLRVVPRKIPLTDEDIVACEAGAWRGRGRIRPPGPPARGLSRGPES